MPYVQTANGVVYALDGETPEQAQARIQAATGYWTGGVAPSNSGQIMQTPNIGANAITAGLLGGPNVVRSSDDPQAQNAYDYPEGRYAIPLVGPNGQRVSSANVGEVDRYIREGYRVLREDGSFATVAPFQGGTLIDNLPINTVVTGYFLPGQADALRAGGIEFDPRIPVNSNSGTPPAGESSNGLWSPRTDFGSSPQFNEGTNPKDIIAQLLNRSLQVGDLGAEDLNSLRDDLKEFLAFNRAALDQTYTKQREITDFLMGKATPAIESAIGNMNEGLSPQAKAALQTQALEQVPANFDRIEQDLRTQLARRGAIGSNLPGSAGDIVREFGGLEADKERLRSGLMSGVVLADEQQRQLNRDRGLSAAGLANSLMGTTGSIFNPATFVSGSGSTLNTILGTGTQQNASRLGGLQLAANLAESRANLEPEALRNIITGGLLGGLTAPGRGGSSILGRIFDVIF